LTAFSPPRSSFELGSEDAGRFATGHYIYLESEATLQPEARLWQGCRLTCLLSGSMHSTLSMHSTFLTQIPRSENPCRRTGSMRQHLY